MKKILACVAAVMVVGATSATAATVITSGQIKDGTIQNRDVKKGAVSLNRLTPGTQDLIRRGSALSAQAKSSQPGATGAQGAQGAAGAKGEKGDTGAQGPRGATGSPGSPGAPGEEGHDGVSGLESDGPYPGTGGNLQQGDNSEEYWTQAGNSSEIQPGLNRSWVRCPDGKIATGGGFTLAADLGSDDRRRTQVTTSQPVQIENGNPDTYNPIPGDADGSFVPNGWLVEGYYDGTHASLVVRPHVICADVGEVEDGDDD